MIKRYNNNQINQLSYNDTHQYWFDIFINDVRIVHRENETPKTFKDVKVILSWHSTLVGMLLMSAISRFMQDERMFP